MRVISVGFGFALGLGALGAAVTSGCGQLWRPFLDPATPSSDDLAVADLASPLDFSASDLGTLPWTLEPSGTRQNLYGVWGVNYTTTVTTVTDGGVSMTNLVTQLPVFAVGAAATILQRDAGSGGWRVAQFNPGADLNLYAVSGRSPTEVIAVGDAQLVAQWNGARWTSSQVASTDAFLAVTPLGGQTSYLGVGTAGLLNIITGTARGMLTAYDRVPADLTSAYKDATRVWVGTSGGDLAKFEQGNFTFYGMPPGKAIRAIWARSDTDVWAVGDGGQVLRFDGTYWSTATTRFPPLTLGLYGVTGNSSGEVWVVGEGATILYFNGTVWSSFKHESQATLRGVLLEPLTGNLWAVGDQGIILHSVVAPRTK